MFRKLLANPMKLCEIKRKEKSQNQLTVIIPHFNDSFRLIRLITSINKSESVELIVIDDASENFHKYVVFFLSKIIKNLKVIFNKSNRGPGYSRNIGLNTASSPYIGFADSDDYYIGYLNSINFNALIDNDVDIIPLSVRNPMRQPQICSGDVTKIFTELSIEDLIYSKSHRFSPEVWGYIFRRDFIEKINCRFLDMYYGEDLIFLLTALSNEPKIVTAPTWQYVHTPSIGLSRAFRNDRSNDLYTLIMKLRSFKQTHGALSKFIEAQEFEIIEHLDISIFFDLLTQTNLATRREMYTLLGLDLNERFNNLKNKVNHLLDFCKNENHVYLYCLSDRSIFLARLILSKTKSSVTIIDDARHGEVLVEGTRIRCRSDSFIYHLKHSLCVIVANNNEETQKNISARLLSANKHLRIMLF